MRITRFELSNFKSYLSPQGGELNHKFNIITGQNNSGKTALLRALARVQLSDPHRSLKTIRFPGVQPEGRSKISIEYEFSVDDVWRATPRGQPVYLSVAGSNADEVRRRTTEILSNVNSTHALRLTSNFEGGSTQAPLLYGALVPLGTNNAIQLGIDQLSASLSITNATLVGVHTDSTIPLQAIEFARKQTYYFNAERPNIGPARIGPTSELENNAQNLAQVLHRLLTANFSAFDRYRQAVMSVLPDVQNITVPPIDENRANVFIWTIDPSSEREDLAIPIEACGTGIGQVMAMLYVALISEHPRIVAIDEPQSFLHPGAVRKLFDILRHEGRHQYIITTHSPVAVSSLDDATILIVRKENMESSIERIEASETQGLRSMLAELGARLSDVFGADNILWVEGPTEERCFRLIVERLVKRKLLGTEILGVRHTGDFDGKDGTRAIEIYEKLSQGRAILPPAIGFVFDRELRSDQQCKDIVKRSGGKVSFLQRRMYENYLLNSGGVAALMSELGVHEVPLESREVESWFETHGWESGYVNPVVPAEERTSELWLTKVHGAKVLDKLFSDLSGARYGYEKHKVEYGLWLTRWLLDNEPGDLQEVADVIESRLDRVE